MALGFSADEVRQALKSLLSSQALGLRLVLPGSSFLF
jgi:hypothetical protein